MLNFSPFRAVLPVIALLAFGSARAEIPWAIYFDLEAFRSLYDVHFVQTMVRDTSANAARCEAIVMSREGHYFLCDGRCEPPAGETDCSIVDRLQGVWELPTRDPPLLFGWARHESWDGPVLLHVGRNGRAVARLPFEPELENIHWLSVVGADSGAVSRQGESWRVEFEFRLRDHLSLGTWHAGLCTKYYTDGMRLGPGIRDALLDSLWQRVSRKRIELRRFVNAYFDHQSERSHLMRMRPSGLPVGNIAPYGLLLPSLEPVAGEAVQSRLLDASQDGLFPYSAGYMPTLADSCLVLEHLNSDLSARRFAEFRTETGGLLPQSCAEPHPGFPEFWCQADYGFTAWAHFLLGREGLAEQATHRYLVDRFEQRSSMFIANPLVINYLTARALAVRGLTENHAETLITDTLAYVNADFSFGDFDPVLSTVFALRTLQESGYFGRQFLQGIVFLLRSCPDGECGSSTPYYSAEKGNDGFDLTFYEDEGLILSAWVEQFLSEVSLDRLHGFEAHRDVPRRPRLAREAYVRHALSNY